ncbi:MAG: DUF2264 domain-containing protein [Armatimonadota bacterium]
MNILHHSLSMGAGLLGMRAQSVDGVDDGSAGAADRAYQVHVLTRIARPVLEALSNSRLKELMPVRKWEKKRALFAGLEVTGRTLSGLAPWLALGEDDTEEGKLRASFIALARKSLINATDPNSPDYVNFNKRRQPLVDASYLAYALLRAPKQLWVPLTSAQRSNVVDGLTSTRTIKPCASNWLLFPAMIEAALWELTGSAEMRPIEEAVSEHMKWYLGDGTYGDGPELHWDYYNSYVIQPYLLEVLGICLRKRHLLCAFLPKVIARAKRYAEIQERLISPEGTYPVIGRSSVYRFAAFHHLAYMSLTRRLPASLHPGAVRSGITAVVRRMVEAPGTFDDQGWLNPGAVGHQTSMRDRYNNTGSFYICLLGLIALGLPPQDPFWTAPAAPWTQKRIWSGDDVCNDHPAAGK